MKFPACVAVLILGLLGNSSAGTFRVATYNVENYLDAPTETRPHVKSPEAKAKVRESIEAVKPDVIALEEIGTTNALLELRDSLKADGLDFPFWEHVIGADTNIHVAVLSRLPIVSRHPHTNDEFLLDGKRFRVSRGFAEVEIQTATNFTFTLLAAHLKSRRPVPNADEKQERLEEAKVLRGIVDGHFKANPDARLIVLGDFNDVKDSDSTKVLIGRGKSRLVDTRPAERTGGNAAWTYHYGIEDTYSRVDYILLSPTMARGWVTNETYIPTIANWRGASDHRPIVATFNDGERNRPLERPPSQQ
jgi:endonuclease/exonuclease/phosphatase family metal-dependent hydrolase